ncbi:hypothetical protein vBAcoSR7M_3 [Alteromonas phage vB_AcoS-R7M]|uniref:Uncharacterized protein n=1 Tax=Alteromonas phage vB_AcoS-R7M TaxID=2729541 RepID=A0A6M3YNA6_9CAUD|nr:hypothetical protein HWD34_gp03 [Alteromonas phage vB_AcoS-R7M]QJI53325.1 hypothetical protein vBAcoSR7M_3 [Alteromonas phage vB_AcoS-R7M]
MSAFLFLLIIPALLCIAGKDLDRAERERDNG